MSFIFQVGSTVIELATNNPNQCVAPVISSDADLILAKLSEGYGAFGHSFNAKRTTAIDLHYALTVAKYKFKLVEGEIKTYDPGIPKGSVT